MGQTRVSRTIQAPIDRVFATIADIRNFSRAVPDIVKVEMLSEVQSGVGTRFRETRMMGRREASTELEVTEYVENDHVRIVADAGGTVWDSVFTTRQVGDDQVELQLIMESRPYRLLSKLMTPLMGGVLSRALAKDMDAVKRYCEGAAPRDDA